jgi:bifunctional non-homologous end joining protein LigD
MVEGPKADPAGGRSPDRLADYRSKRSAEKTPEPVPGERAKATDGRSFII